MRLVSPVRQSVRERRVHSGDRSRMRIDDHMRTRPPSPQAIGVVAPPARDDTWDTLGLEPADASGPSTPPLVENELPARVLKTLQRLRSPPWVVLALALGARSAQGMLGALHLQLLARTHALWCRDLN